MQLKKKDILAKYWLLVFFIIMYGFIYFFKISFRDIWQTVTTLTYLQLLLLVTVYFLFSFCTILVRRYLLFALQSRCSIKNLLYIHFSSMAAHYSTPVKIGFPLAVYLLNKFEKISYSTGTSMILIELTVNMLIAGGFAFIGNAFFFSESQGIVIRAGAVFVIVLVLIVTASWLVVSKCKLPKVTQAINNISNAYRKVTFKNILVYFLLAASVQLIGVTNLLLLTRFFSDGISILQAVTVSSTAFFLGAMSMVPMGLGVREGIVIFFLKQLGLSNTLGVSIVSIQRLLSTGLTFLLGGICGIILGVNKKVTESSKNTSSTRKSK